MPATGGPGDELDPSDVGSESDEEFVPTEVGSTVEPAPDRERDALLRFQPSGTMIVGQTYPVEAQAYFAGMTPNDTLVPFDPSAPTTVVPLIGASCRVTAELVFRTGDFDVPANRPRTINLCDGRDAAVWTWLVTPLRAATLKLTVVLTSAESGDELRSTFADISVAAEPSVATAARAVDPSLTKRGSAETELAGTGSDGGGFPVLPLALTGAFGLVLAGGWRIRAGRERPPARATPVQAFAPPRPGDRTVLPSPGQARTVFLSYSRRDTPFLDRLGADLEARGFDTWRDTDDIEGGEQWRSTIVDALGAASTVVLLLSPSSVESVNVAREIALADELKKRVLPVTIADGVKLDGALQYTLAGTQTIDLREPGYAAGFAQLVRALELTPQPPESHSPM